MDARARTRLRRHLALVDQGVAPVVTRYREHIECRAGCSDCCRQRFTIPTIEAELLLEGLDAADADRRAAIVARAHAHHPAQGDPCPVLDDDGRCSLYEHRPRICRKYGIPLWHPDRPHEVRTCEKNFRGVHDIEMDAIVEPQAAWAADWIAVRRELGLGGQRITIAAAIVAHAARSTPGDPPT